jgi:hypothetical protein
MDDRPSLHHDAERALLDVIEGWCPLCKVRLVNHDGVGCCPCGGCSYRFKDNTFELKSCVVHPAKACIHWDAVWSSRIDRRW